MKRLNYLFVITIVLIMFVLDCKIIFLKLKINTIETINQDSLIHKGYTGYKTLFDKINGRDWTVFKEYYYLDNKSIFANDDNYVKIGNLELKDYLLVLEYLQLKEDIINQNSYYKYSTQENFDKEDYVNYELENYDNGVPNIKKMYYFDTENQILYYIKS